MRWYWEAGHFKRELGDRIIARIRGGGDEGFGVRLDASVIDSALAHIRQGEASYRQQRPAEFMALSKLVAGMKRASTGREGSGRMENDRWAIAPAKGEIHEWPA